MGQSQARINPIGKLDADAHSNPACPHTCRGPIVEGSPGVILNSLPASGKGGMGGHAACCGANICFANSCSQTVNISGLSAHGTDDSEQPRGGMVKMTIGSGDVSTGG